MQTTRGRSEEPRPRSKSQSVQPRRARSRATSRDSSVSSATREVRCGCQFFQSDSLLPERVNPVGRPSSRTSNIMSTTTPQVGDHEYEPIAAPPPKIQGPHITDDLDLGPDEEFDAIKLQTKSETSSTSSRERRFLRIPLDDELVILPGDGEDEEEAMGIKSMEGENGEAKAKQLSVPDIDIQDDRYFTATPTTTESRTDYDVNTSQLDSSGLEDVPLKREARKKKLQEVADQQAEARGFQQRLRSQAGRIRSKLRSMPRPNIKFPERPKFNLPERPKFNLPERPKFHLPERPKFNLPERPKFNFPDRSKFHMPERPKFNFPERPKFTMPERPKFMTERPKFLTERPKFNLPQRPKISMPSFGMGKDRKDKPHFSSTRRPLRDRSNVSSASTTSSTKKHLFDFDFRSYPRIFDRKSRRADYATSSPKASRGQTPPPQMPSRKKGRWLQKFTDLKYEEDTPQPSASEGTGVASRVTDELEAEEFREDIDMAEGAESVGGRSESTSAFRDKDFGYAVTIDDHDRPTVDDERRRMQASSSSVGEARSSGSSSLRHRAGVLEEIDSDEFFLREKGLSQEDVEVGRYLTSEIRDAFRAPVSALSQMDNYEYYDDEEDVENLGQQYRSTPDRGPTRPARTRSLRTRKRSSKSKSPAEEEDSSQFFNTFPPARPKRIRRGQQQEELEISKEKEGYEQEMEVDEEPAKAGIPSFTVIDEDEKYRQQSLEEPEAEDQWQIEEHAVAELEPPIPPKRLRRGRKEPNPDALCNGHYTKEDWLENIQAQIVPIDEVMVMRTESDYIIPAAPPEDFELPPEAPRRGRRKSSRATSLADEDRTSRGASSLPSERDHATDDFPVDLSLPEIPGYACVEKPSTKPRRKTSRPSAPGRRKRSTNGHSRSYPHFYSLPHRPPPIRPLRNYSTLGPSRPPRRHKAPPPLELDQKSESYIEIEDDMLEPTSHFEESHGSARDLQSGDIIQRMKGRPLPPPPRPPRKGRETQDSQDELEMEDIIDGEAPLYKDDELEEHEELFDVTKEEPLGALSDKVFYAQSGVTTMEDEELEEDLPKENKESSPFELEKEELEKEEELEEEKEFSPVLSEEKFKESSSIPGDFEVEEVSIAIQTDPLPDDVCVVTGEEEVSISYATVSTETTGLEPSPPRTFEFGQQTIPIPPPPPPEPTIIEKPIPYYVMPDPDAEVELKASKLQITELDVERLNVGELQAQKIKVSDIDGISLQVTELTSKSGNLVLSGLELPSGFLQELIESLPIPQPPPPVQVPVYIPVSAVPPSQSAAAEQPVFSQPLPPTNSQPLSPVTTQPISPSFSQPVSPTLISAGSTSPPQSPLTSDAPESPFVSQPVSEEPEVSSTSVQSAEAPGASSPPDEDPPSESVSSTNSPSQSEPSPNPPAQSIPSPNPPSQSEPSPNSPSQSEPSPNSPAQPEPSPNSPAQSIPSPNPPSQSEPSPNSPAQSEPSPNSPAQSIPSPNPPSQSEPSPNPPAQSIPSPNPPSPSEPSTNPPSSEPSPNPYAQSTPSSNNLTQSTSSPNNPAQSTPSPNPPTQSIPSPNAPSNSISESIPLKKSAPEPKPDSASPQIPFTLSPQAPTAAEIPSPPIPQAVPVPPQLSIPPQQGQSIPIQSIPLHYPNIVTSLDGLHTYIPPEYMPAQVPVSVRIPSRARSHLSHSQRELESEEEMISLMHTPTSRRRRHHLSKPVARYSSDEEEEEDYGSYRPPSRRHHSSSRAVEGSVGDLSQQLFHACQGVTMRALNHLVQYVSAVREGEDKRRDLQIALCFLLLLVAGLILMGYGSGKTYHTHHWDYHFPPRH